MGNANNSKKNKVVLVGLPDVDKTTRLNPSKGFTKKHIPILGDKVHPIAGDYSRYIQSGEPIDIIINLNNGRTEIKNMCAFLANNKLKIFRLSNAIKIAPMDFEQNKWRNFMESKTSYTFFNKAIINPNWDDHKYCKFACTVRDGDIIYEGIGILNINIKISFFSIYHTHIYIIL